MSTDPTPENPPGAIPPEGMAGAGEDKEGDPFRLHVSKDRMRVHFDCDTLGRDLEALAEAVLARLLLFGVRKPPAMDALRAWLREQSTASSQIVDAIIMEGVYPLPPVDGHIEWGGDFFNPGFLVDEATGRINFRKRAAERNVKSGQLLATIIEPVPGKNGFDVTGEVIRVRKPRTSRIRVGANVRADAATASYYATRDGRIRWDNESLSVDELYEVRGDVGLETGDISHEGAVIVHGDVLEGARLEAIGDVEILGTIDGGHVQTGGMLHVHGGITGRHGTRVVAAGGVRARYILDADVQSNGDIVVEKEVMHSHIATRGVFCVPQGRVVGGHAIALGGIDVGQAGSLASVPTELAAGQDYGIEGRIAILKNELQLREANVEKVRRTIGAVRGKIAALPENSKVAIRELLARLPGMVAAVDSIREQLDAVRAQSRANARNIILIRRQLFPETRLVMRRETYHVREEFSGPVRPVYIGGRLRLSNTRMRSISTTEHEEEITTASLIDDENETP